MDSNQQLLVLCIIFATCLILWYSAPIVGQDPVKKDALNFDDYYPYYNDDGRLRGKGATNVSTMFHASHHLWEKWYVGLLLILLSCHLSLVT
jgi:hypothetical protein